MIRGSGRPMASERAESRVAAGDVPSQADTHAPTDASPRNEAAASPFAPGKDEQTVRLRILATSDLHGQLLSYDHYTGQPLQDMGLALVAGLIDAARREVPQAILVDNGDFLQGSALTEMAGTLRRAGAHPAITAFNCLNYDAVTLGNHEFNYGLDYLAAILGEARFAPLSGNVTLVENGEPLPLVRPFLLLERELPDPNGQLHPVRIGLLGLTPGRILEWDRDHLEGRVTVADMRETVRQLVPRLRAEGADVVICLAHSGIATGDTPVDSDHLAGEIARIDGVDVVVAGHSHVTYPLPDEPSGREEIATTATEAPPALLIQPGHSGSHLAVIDLWLRRDPAGQWKVVAREGRNLATAEASRRLSEHERRAAAHPLRRALEADHRAAEDWLSQTIGRSEATLSTWFSTVADSQAMQLLAAIKLDYLRQCLDTLIDPSRAGLPLLAAVRPFRSGGRGGPQNFTHIPAGDLTLRHIFCLYPFPNTFSAVCISGAALRERLERSANVFHTLRAGEPDQPLLDPRVPPQAFEIIHGLQYEIDLSRPPMAGRIRNLRHHGRPVGLEDLFLMATSNFNASPGPSGQLVLNCDRLLSDIMRDYIRRHEVIRPMPCGSWSFTPLPGTTVLYDTSAEASPLMEEVEHLNPRSLGHTPDGFHRFRLHL